MAVRRRWRRWSGAGGRAPCQGRRDGGVLRGGQGSGPGLVLVHWTGWSAAGTWCHLLRRFEEWTVVTPDLAGSGATVDPGGPLELDDLATQVAGAADAAGLERYAIVGFSLGAAVAAALAAREPDPVSALVLVSGAVSGAGARSRLQFELWRDLHRTNPELFARLWMLIGFSAPFVEGIPVADVARAATFPIAPGIERQCDLNTRIDLSEQVKAIRAPTLVLGCSHGLDRPARRCSRARRSNRGRHDLRGARLRPHGRPRSARCPCGPGTRLPARCRSGMNSRWPTMRHSPPLPNWPPSTAAAPQPPRRSSPRPTRGSSVATGRSK